MKLFMLESEESPIPSDDLDSIALIRAPDLIDKSATEWHRPFIYCSDLPRRLYVGPDYGYHMALLRNARDIGDKEYGMLHDVYVGIRPGAVGRIGRGLRSVPDLTDEDGDSGGFRAVHYPNLEIVTFYLRDDDLGYAAASVKHLIGMKFVSPEAIVVHNRQVVDTNEFIKNAIKEPELDAPESKSKHMQTHMKNAGLLAPGQKWWAPQSESFINRLNAIFD